MADVKVRNGIVNDKVNQNKTCQVFERNKILNSFDLRKFEDTDLSNVVRKSELFNEKDICDVLQEKLEARNNELEQFRQSALQSPVSVSGAVSNPLC